VQLKTKVTRCPWVCYHDTWNCVYRPSTNWVCR